jgi:Glycosyl hydrolase family 76
MTERQSRRAFIARSAGLAAGAATLSLVGSGVQAAVGPAVASAHNVSGNKARAGELYTAMQSNYYLGAAQGSLYNETSPRAKSNPYAYLWPFYEAMAGTIDLYGVGALAAGDLNDRLVGLSRYARGPQAGYDSYPRSPYGAGGDRYDDDNAWVARAFIQLHRMNALSSALSSAQDVFAFLYQTGWVGDGSMYWVTDGHWNFDRGTGPTGGFAKVALHLSELVSDSTQKTNYLDLGTQSYNWVNTNLLAKQGDYAGKLYWDKINGDGSLDTRFWSYNQGVMIGAAVLSARLASDTTQKARYVNQAVATADAAIAYYNSVGWYSQPVIFNSLFFRNLLMLYAVDPRSYDRFRQAAQTFADNVWNDPKIHNMQKHMIKFDPTTSVYKLREQAGMVQIYACLAWVDAGKDLKLLS